VCVSHRIGSTPHYSSARRATRRGAIRLYLQYKILLLSDYLHFWVGKIDREPIPMAFELQVERVFLKTWGLSPSSLPWCTKLRMRIGDYSPSYRSTVLRGRARTSSIDRLFARRKGSSNKKGLPLCPSIALIHKRATGPFYERRRHRTRMINQPRNVPCSMVGCAVDGLNRAE
jgi:hypothetical protein